MLSAPAGRWLVALALVGAALTGCGKKGPPVAPELRLPLAPGALRATIDEDTIVVSWSNPTNRADGTSLKDLSTVTLYRHEDSDEAPLKPAMLSSGRIVGYDEMAAIRLDSPAPAVVRGGTVQWVDRRGLVSGRRYVYVVTGTDSFGRTGPPSERLAVPFLSAPRPPRNVRVSPGDRQVTLAWDAPTELADGSPVTGRLVYVVLRGAGSGGALSPVTAAGIAGTTHTDTGLDNDSEYRYAVRAVRVDPRVAATGAPSSAVTAIPVDTTPPSPPTDLVAVPSPGAVRLAWRASPEEDVALYAVYRATAAAGFTRIGTALTGTTTFIDRDVRPGATYRYAVTAFDRANKPNESGRSAEVSVTTP